MLGIALLLISIILYINGKKKYSLLIFLSFCSRGFVLLTDNIIGFKNQDAALLYFVIIFLYSYFNEKHIKYVHNINIEKWLKIFLVFMLFNVLFSMLFYQLDIIQIIQGGRQYFIIFAFFFIRKIKSSDLEWILKKIIYITLITSVLYIIQCQTGLPTLPDSEQNYSNDSVDGTFRYYNVPPFLDISLFLLIFYSKYFKGWKNIIAIAIMFVALLCTQGRTQIAGTIMVILIGLYLNGSYKKLVKYGLLGLIAITPFMPLLMERFESDDKSTGGDLQAIIDGDFMNVNGQFAGSMTFRFALVYERMAYLADRSVGEQIFGMGLLSDQQKELVRRMYHFNIGLKDRETGEVVQLSTPDIAYGNLICRLGFVGMAIYLVIWGIMLVQAYKNRKVDIIVFCLFLYLFNYIFGSFSGATISYTENIVLPMMLIVYMDKMKLLNKRCVYEK